MRSTKLEYPLAAACLNVIFICAIKALMIILGFYYPIVISKLKDSYLLRLTDCVVQSIYFEFGNHVQMSGD